MKSIVVPKIVRGILESRLPGASLMCPVVAPDAPGCVETGSRVFRVKPVVQGHRTQRSERLPFEYGVILAHWCCLWVEVAVLKTNGLVFWFLPG